jgi:hypothetical protein
MDQQLRQIWESIWERLERSADTPGGSWWLPVFSTVTAAGLPAARTVVLRRCERSSRHLYAYTDVRAPKVQQLENQGAAVWTFYAAQEREQLVVRTKTRVLRSGEEYEECWHRCRPESLWAYVHASPPGVRVATPPPLPGTGPVPPELRQLTRERFVVLASEVEHLDWLSLRPEGNVRAQFEWRAGDWQGNWVTP